MSGCGYDGTAVIRRRYIDPARWEELEWSVADERIHITRELLENEEARSVIEGKYVIGEWCPETHAFHADLKERA